MNISLFNIQKYSLHDGSGIRTNIFFKGCPLRCMWCANPESQNFYSELLWDEKKCIGCNACFRVCPKHMVEPMEECNQCLLCTDVCCTGARKRAGEQYDVETVMEKIQQDELFYRLSGGGVTFTGGEPFGQPAALAELAERVKQKGITTAIETCGHVKWDVIQSMLPLLDIILYDVKLMDSDRHKKYTGVDNAQILSNLEALARICPDKITVRVPLIGGVNDSAENLKELMKWMKKNNLKKIDFLPYHRMGESKYLRLSRNEPDKFAIPEKCDLENIKRNFIAQGFHAGIFG